MKKDKEVKRKFNFKKLILVLLILYLFSFFIYQFLLTPIKNIYISNNKYLTDQEIIDISGISDYPSFFLTSKYSIKKKLLKNNMINSVTISKKLFGKIYIDVNENKPLFYYSNIKKLVLSDGATIDSNNYIVPKLINKVNEDLLKKLVTKANLINDDILILVSEIKYLPNDIDKERFVFIMNDGNYVYVTLTKIKSINEYLNILPTLENKKGILYLDSGNYFEIFK